jgi:hypothetical protein
MRAHDLPAVLSLSLSRPCLRAGPRGEHKFAAFPHAKKAIFEPDRSLFLRRELNSGARTNFRRAQMTMGEFNLYSAIIINNLAE